LASSHQKVSDEVRQCLGFSVRLMWLSVGVEVAEDIAADLLQALA